MLRDARVRLFLTSVTLLFVELLLIRWVPANVVYVGFFKDSDAADLAFGANLVGAMVGGVLEWSALVTGYQALLMVVAGIYVLAWIARPHSVLTGEPAMVVPPLTTAPQQGSR